MNTITVQEYRGPHRIRLNKLQTQLFLHELARVKRSRAGRKGAPPLASPDCLITVSTGQRKTHYALYGRAMLVQPKAYRTWQFYFGLLLLEWLYR